MFRKKLATCCALLKLHAKEGYFLLAIKSGFTLIEMLLYMGLLSIFLMVLTTVFISILDLKADSVATSSVELDGRFIVNRLAYDVARSSSVTTPATIGGSGSTLAIVINGVTHTYALSSGNLVLTNNQGATPLNSSSETTVTGWSVERLGNSGVTDSKDKIKITLTIASQTRRDKGIETRTFQTTVGRK